MTPEGVPERDCLCCTVLQDVRETTIALNSVSDSVEAGNEVTTLARIIHFRAAVA